MEQNDLDLLQAVPLSHLQTVARARRLSQVIALLGNLPVITAQSPHTAGESTNGSNGAIPVISSSAALGIAPYLFDPQALNALLLTLSEDAALVLRELVACDGRVNSRDMALYFQHKYGWGVEKIETDVEHAQGVGVADAAPGDDEDAQIIAQAQEMLLYARYPEARPHGIFELALHQLLKWGLIFWGKQTHFAGRDYISGVHDGLLIVPPSVMQIVHNLWPPATLHALQAAPVLEIAHPSEQLHLFQRLLYLYWFCVSSAREGLPLVNNGLLARTAVRSLCEQLDIEYNAEQMRLESDLPYLLFTRLLLQQLGLIDIQKSALVARPAQDFFSLPLSERVQRCYRAYMEMPFWNEMIRLPDINVRPAPDPLTPAHPEIMHARHQVAARLLIEVTETTETTAVSTEAEPVYDLMTFIARTKLYIPSLLFPRQYGPRAERYSKECNPYGYDFRLRRGWLTHREGWHIIEGGFIRSMLTEPLQWLGLLHVERQAGRLTFRVAPEMLALLRKQSVNYTHLMEGRLLVQPNFELVALAPVSEGTLCMLDSFAERVRLEHVAQYRLTRASVVRAIRHGLSSEILLRYMGQHLGAGAATDVPQNVHYSLVEWERQARRMEIWPGLTLIEVADITLLDELLTADETRELFGRRLAPTLAEVPTQHLPAVQELLWQRAILPALTPAPEQDLTFTDEESIFSAHDPQWQLHANGLLEPVYAVLDLYLVAALAQFSVVDTQSGWPRITEASLQQALHNGLAFEAIIRFLRHYCVADIPGSLLIRFKLWSGSYDANTQQIQVERSPLLRLPGEILRDIQQDEELASLLGSEITDQQRIVRVSEQNLAHVLTLLRERGLLITPPSSDE
ncbi:helicase-associated domain-containing protein [Ktedonobacteria bacterium brp13]|nr:helicase-associated domain-containing protein [Ktedonobacteria bacterium brp13]